VIVNGQALPAKKASERTLTTKQQFDRINDRLMALEMATGKLSQSINKLIEVSGSGGSGSVPKPDPIPIPIPDVDENREPPNPELLLILARSCVQCHAPPVVDELGGGFAMYEAPRKAGEVPKLKRMSALDWVRIDYSVYSGDMPKFGDPLPSDDVGEIRSYANELRHEVYSALRPK
jgi:hypothetical protein